MISDSDRAAIEASAAALDVDEWRGLDSSERDLVRRALAPAPEPVDKESTSAA